MGTNINALSTQGCDSVVDDTLIVDAPRRRGRTRNSLEHGLLFLIVMLAPHTKFPGASDAYPFRPVDLVAMLGFACLFSVSLSPQRRAGYVESITRAWIAVLFVSLYSAFWGHYFLSQNNAIVVHDGPVTYYYEVVVARKLILLIACFCTLWLFLTTKVKAETLYRWWLWSLSVAVAAQVLVYLLTADYFLRRAGVFVEGNHGSGYFVMSFFMMWLYARRQRRPGRAGMIIALLGLTLSQSSSGILTLLLLSGIYFVRLTGITRVFAFKNLRYIVLAVAVGGGLSVLFGAQLITKLTDEDLNSASYSRYDRLSSAMSGVNMFLHHPLSGVGIQGYAFALDSYAEGFLLDIYHGDNRRIANNIYAEILSEQGAIGGITFGWLLYTIYRALRRKDAGDLLAPAGFWAMLLTWMAFPTYTVSFNWAALGMLVVGAQWVSPKALRPALRLQSRRKGDTAQELLWIKSC